MDAVSIEFVATILALNAAGTIYLARRVGALETELLGVYMDLYDRLGLGDPSDDVPRVKRAVIALRELRRKGP